MGDEESQPGNLRLPMLADASIQRQPIGPQRLRTEAAVPFPFKPRVAHSRVRVFSRVLHGGNTASDEPGGRCPMSLSAHKSEPLITAAFSRSGGVSDHAKKEAA